MIGHLLRETSIFVLFRRASNSNIPSNSLDSLFHLFPGATSSRDLLFGIFTPKLRVEYAK